MFFSRKLLAAVPEFPIGMTPPNSYTTQTIVDLSNSATYQTGVFSDTGWYRVKIGAADGQNASSASGGKGGYASKIFFAYSGTKYIIWGCNGVSTGYPNPSNKLGGAGGDGRGYSWHVPAPINVVRIAGGWGGGSATSNGSAASAVFYGSHSGGAGAGFVCGMDETTSGVSTETETFNEAGHFSVDTVFTMVLAGGGGGAGADKNAYSSGSDTTGGGGGGGAWGDGGTGGSSGSHGDGASGTAGPGETSGKGANAGSSTSSSAGAGGNGGWAIRDYTTNTFSYGSGTNGRPAAQVCILEKLIY